MRVAWNVNFASTRRVQFLVEAFNVFNAEVVMVGIPAHSMWRTAKGIGVFGPRHFGHDLDCVPLEALQKRRSKQFS
jgi:hypothetical protein